MTDDSLRGLRIIFVLPGFQLGGAERQALLLAIGLRQEWFADTKVWSFGKPDGRVIELCEINHIPWRNAMESPPVNHWKRMLAYSLRFGVQLRKVKPSIILSYTTWPNLLCGLSWKLSGARLYVWNQRDEGLGMTGRAIEPWSIRLTPWFTANSETGSTFLQSRGVRPSKLSVIHNGVSLPLAQYNRQSWKNRLEIDEATLLVVMVANLQKFKDHSTLLHAWQNVCQQLPIGHKAVLALAGGFHGTEALLKTLVNELNIGSKVRFLGAVDDITGLLETADLAVYSSISEGLPNAVLECMAAGLAIVATDIPGVREAIGKDDFSMLVPKGDYQKMASNLLLLLQDASLRQKIGNQNRQRIKNEFQPDMMVNKMAHWIIQGLQ